MHLLGYEDCENYKLVAFYSAFSCISFSTLLSALYFTNYLYSIGRYSFYPVIGVVVVAEYTKYLLGTFHLVKDHGKRYDIYVPVSRRNSMKGKIKELLKCVFVMILMVWMYFFIAVVFGAEVFSKHEETFMLSAMLCALTVFPACLNLGSGSVISLVFGMKINRDIIGESLQLCYRYTLFGTWLGAFVIPLDWDRPWQAWPIPCALGAMLGFTIGNLIMLLRLLPKMVTIYYSKSGKKC